MDTIDFLRKMGERIALHKARKSIDIYDGSKETFLKWINAIEVQMVIHSLDNQNTIKLVLSTISGSISEFILLFLDGNLNTDWAILKAHLIGRFTTVNELGEKTIDASTGEGIKK